MSSVSAWRSMGTPQQYESPASLPDRSYAICVHACPEPPTLPALCQWETDIHSMIAQMLLQNDQTCFVS